MRLRIAARKSDLARLQASQVGEALQKKHPHLQIEYQFRESLGDQNLADPLWKMPEKGVFTEDFVQELLTDKTDVVVHSWKDLPTERGHETVIAATLPRADQKDLLLFKPESLKKNSLKIFSSSPRREENLQKLLPQLLPIPSADCSFVPVRGNVQTRVRKFLEATEIDGLVVAKAAMDRLLSSQHQEFSETRTFLRKTFEQILWMVLPLSENPTAAAQGALAIEILDRREDLKTLLKDIHCLKTFASVWKERQLLKSYGGGCHLALGISVVSVSDDEYFYLCAKGRTPQGNSFHQKELHSWKPDRKVPQFLLHELGTLPSEKVIRNKRAEPIAQDQHIVGYIISRSEAWPQMWKQQGPLWAAGLSTWKNLAQRGLWICGSFEGLGATAIPPVGELVSKNLLWKTLTHQKNPSLNPRTHIATYDIDISLEHFDASKKFYFWRSSSQFLSALELYPSLRQAYHASGPGSTWQTLKANLSPQMIFLFINEEDWRQQCTLPQSITNVP